jgi:hypothetical protein
MLKGLKSSNSQRFPTFEVQDKPRIPIETTAGFHDQGPRRGQGKGHVFFHLPQFVEGFLGWQTEKNPTTEVSGGKDASFVPTGQLQLAFRMSLVCKFSLFASGTNARN